MKVRTILTYIACIIVFLGVAEGYMRYKGYIPAPDIAKCKDRSEITFDSELGWASAFYDNFPAGDPDMYSILTKIWPDGQRESRPFLKQHCNKRVLVLGCSHTFGIGVKAQETFTWLLNERFPDIEFDNMAFPGYGTIQCYLNEKKQLKRRPYDLVLYAPINDHVYRNVFAMNCIRDIEIFNESLQDIIKQNHVLWFQPTANIDSHHQLIVHVPYYEHWPLDQYSALSNTLKRITMFTGYAQELKHFSDPIYITRWREVYWRILWRMNDIAQAHGSKFAVVCLEDDTLPHAISFPDSAELAPMNSGTEKLTFPPPFFYGYAGNGRKGAPDGPQFHAGGIVPSGHPTAIVHKVWADEIAKMIPELIINS